MLFNSYIFIFLFLPITFCLYWLFKHLGANKASYITLIAASIIFYGYQHINYAFLLIASIVFNYFLCKKIKGNRLLLFTGIIFNLGILFYFKYFNFFISNINSISGKSFNMVNIILPLGISFYTFQQVSYVVDSYKGLVPEYSFMEYALFVSFFPQLIAGPIVLHSETIPQFHNNQNKTSPSSEDLYTGAQYFILGLAKKLLIADVLGRGVDWGYNNILWLNTFTAIFIILAYTLQIYFDFSGYCDMAIGLGHLFGIKITQNFDSPYKSLSISEFWKRWHITLTRFLTTYIYIPLGGNRKGALRTYLNVLIVFTISGLWHGASWTFVLWGMLHGILMIIERITGKERLNKIPSFLRFIYTFGAVNILWILFRANTFIDALNILKRILHGGGGLLLDDCINAMFPSSTAPYFEFLNITTSNTLVYIIIIALLLIAALYLSIRHKNTAIIVDENHISFGYTFLLAVLFIISLINLSSVSAFLYFNF